MKSNRIFYYRIGYCILSFSLSILFFQSCKKKQDVTPTSDPIQKPTVDFSFTITASGTLPTKVSFVNNSKNADNSKWYFGDGNTFVSANPDNTYQTASFDVKWLYYLS